MVAKWNRQKLSSYQTYQILIYERHLKFSRIEDSYILAALSKRKIIRILYGEGIIKHSTDRPNKCFLKISTRERKPYDEDPCENNILAIFEHCKQNIRGRSTETLFYNEDLAVAFEALDEKYESEEFLI